MGIPYSRTPFVFSARVKNGPWRTVKIYPRARLRIFVFFSPLLKSELRNLGNCGFLSVEFPVLPLLQYVTWKKCLDTNVQGISHEKLRRLCDRIWNREIIISASVKQLLLLSWSSVAAVERQNGALNLFWPNGQDTRGRRISVRRT